MSKLQLHLHTRAIMPACPAEEETRDLPGSLTAQGDCLLLTFSDGSDAGAAVETALSFSPATPGRITLRTRGVSEAEMHFAEGEADAGLYHIPGVGTLDFSLRTVALLNTLSPQGGRLRLSYVLEIGGQTRHMLFSLHAMPQKEGDDADQ